MKYTVKYSNPNTQYIPIQATFNVKKEDEVTLQFPTWRPGRYELGDFAKNIHSFEVLNDQGKQIDFEKTSKSSWLVSTKKTDQITVRYRYYAAELNAGSTYMDEQQLYMNPVNCLVFIEAQQSKSCSLKVEVPAHFKLACGAKHEENLIKCESFHELVDSPFIASPNLVHLDFDVKKVKFHLWFQGEVKLDEKKIIEDFQKYTLAQINMFGDFPVDEYHYLFQIQNIKAYHGVEHQTSTVVSLGPTYDLMTVLYNDFLGVSSHELYHTWNIKALRPKEMYPYDYTKENFSRLGYVAEGVTTYMGDLFLCISGVKDFVWYKNELEVLLQRHFDNFGRFNYSVAESSWDTWLDGYVAGAPNRKVSIYNEGALLSFVTDMKIRKSTNNKASLHDVMTLLYQTYAKKNKGYSEKDFRKACELVGGLDLKDYFEKFYYGKHSFESILTEALEVIGYSIQMKSNPDPAISILGVKCLEKEGKPIVKQIYPGSTADLGGIMLEDEILTINGKNVKGDLANWVKFYETDQLELTINRSGRILNIICPHTNKSYFPQYKLVKGKSVSNLSKRIFKKWCGAEY